jgi:hypothetical protein
VNAADENTAALITVAEGLEELLPQVAFVGGASVVLYLDEAARTAVRATKDVDIVIELAGLGQYADLEKKLRRKGFVNAIHPDDPICRWNFESKIVDVMPSDGSILGFSNQWYPDAMKVLEQVALSKNLTINVFEMHSAQGSLMAYLQERLGRLSSRPDAEEVLLAHLPPEPTAGTRASTLLKALQGFVAG